MKFLHRFVIINVVNNEIPAYFSVFGDAYEHLQELRKRHPYHKYELFEKYVEEDLSPRGYNERPPYKQKGTAEVYP